MTRTTRSPSAPVIPPPPPSPTSVVVVVVISYVIIIAAAAGMIKDGVIIMTTATTTTTTTTTTITTITSTTTTTTITVSSGVLLGETGLVLHEGGAGARLKRGLGGGAKRFGRMAASRAWGGVGLSTENGSEHIYIRPPIFKTCIYV